MRFYQNQMSFFGLNEKNNTSEYGSIVYGQWTFVLFESFFRFWTFFPIAAFGSFHYEESVCSEFSFDFSLGHQITLSEVDVIDCEAHSIVVGFVFVKIHSAQSICVGYLLSWCVLQLIVETY